MYGATAEWFIIILFWNKHVILIWDREQSSVSKKINFKAAFKAVAEAGNKVVVQYNKIILNIIDYICILERNLSQIIALRVH